MGAAAAKEGWNLFILLLKNSHWKRKWVVFSFYLVCGLIKKGEKKVFHLHCAIMGFQIIYYTKVITVNFSLCENSATRASLSKEVGLHREQEKLLGSEWRESSNIKEDNFYLFFLMFWERIPTPFLSYS